MFIKNYMKNYLSNLIKKMNKNKVFKKFKFLKLKKLSRKQKIILRMKFKILKLRI